jgi:hypothetical protein
MIGWIRVATSAPADPKVFALADALGIDPMHALGAMVAVMTHLPAHAPDGNLHAVPPALLEHWAAWRGERGAFAAAFAAHVLTEGAWVAWPKHNGIAIEKAERDAARLREIRDQRRAERAASRDGRATEHETSRDGRATNREPSRDEVACVAGTRRDETRRDETNYQEETTPTAAAARPHVERLRDTVKADGGEYPAIAARIRASRNPDAVAQALLGEVQPTGRAGVTLAVLNQALHEMAANDAEFGVKLLRGYIRGVLAAPPPPATGRVVGRVPRPDPNAPPDYDALLANVKPRPTEAA